MHYGKSRGLPPESGANTILRRVRRDALVVSSESSQPRRGSMPVSPGKHDHTAGCRVWCAIAGIQPATGLIGKATGPKRNNVSQYRGGSAARFGSWDFRGGQSTRRLGTRCTCFQRCQPVAVGRRQVTEGSQFARDPAGQVPRYPRSDGPTPKMTRPRSELHMHTLLDTFHFHIPMSTSYLLIAIAQLCWDPPACNHYSGTDTVPLRTDTAVSGPQPCRHRLFTSI